MKWQEEEERLRPGEQRAREEQSTAETDEPALIRMLTARGMKDSDVSCVQKVDDSNTSMLPTNAKKNLKRKLSYKLSFKSEAQMINAIEMLQSKDQGDGLEFDVSAVIADDSPVVKLEGFEGPQRAQTPQ